MSTRGLAAIALAVGMLAGGTPALADYPERSLHATIPWGAGGATDRVMRALTPYVEEELGTEIVITNRPGDTATLGTLHVMQQRPADGYHLLMAADDAAVARDGFQAFLTENGAEPLNLSGAEAQAFLDHWQSVTSWALYDAGAVPVSPEQFDIPRPE